MGTLSHIESCLRTKLVSDIDYELNLTLFPNAAKFKGESLISFRFTNDSVPRNPSKSLLSSLFAVQTPISTWLDSKEAVILSYSFDLVPSGAVQPTLHSVKGRVNISGLVSGVYKLRISYEMTWAEDGFGLIRWEDPEDGEVYVYSNCEPYGANGISPCFDQPDLKATIQMSVTGPTDWKVICNAPLTSKNAFSYEGNPVEIRKFERTQKISTYLWAVCLGNFCEWTSPCDFLENPLRLYCRKSIFPFFPADRLFAWTISGFQYLMAFFNQSYEFRKYDQVFVPNLGSGAMENVGCVIYDDSCLSLSGLTFFEEINLCNTVLHEMVHVWMGNTVTMRWWDDIWLNESFATYLSAKAQMTINPTQRQSLIHTFLAYKEIAYDFDEVPNPKPVKREIETADCKHQAFDMIVYVKGSSLLEQLEFAIGEDVFQRLLQTWVQRHKYSTVTSDDFRCLLESENRLPIRGNDWLRQWILEAGVNELEAEVQHQEGKITSFRVKQRLSQHAKTAVFREHHLILSFYDDSYREYIREKIVIPSTEFVDFPQYIGTRNPFLLILNSEEQAHCKVAIPPSLLRTIDISQIPNSTTRHLLIRSLIHQVRDLSISAAEFIEKTVKMVETEPEIGICIFLFGVFNLFLQGLVRPGNDRKRLASRVFACGLVRIRKETDLRNISELQSHIFLFLIHPADIMEAVSWLKTDSRIAPFRLRPIDRVAIIKAYATISVSAIDLAKSEESLFPSTETRFLTVFCGAAAPVPFLKDRVFAQIHTQAKSLPIKELKSLMRGFSQANQVWLYPFGIRILTDFGDLARPGLRDVAEDYVGGMAPSYLPLKEVLRKVGGLGWVLKLVSKRLGEKFQEAIYRLTRYQKCRDLSEEFLYALNRRPD